MKKILTLSLLLAGFSLPAYMQDRVPVEPYQPSEYFFETLSRARSMGRDIYVDDTNIPAPQAAPAAANADEQQIGYVNPAGTLFLGMDEAGKGTFFKTPGVIGGWSDSIPCWKWLNKQVGYKSIKYLTAFSYAYPSYSDGENYGVDEYGNFCDTILASGGYTYYMEAAGDEGYYWQHATPLQTARYQDAADKNFMLLSSSFVPSAENCPLAAGGLPSGNTADGLWPLTNAVNTNRSGTSIELIDYVAGDGYVSYLFGSSMYTIDSVLVPNAAQTADSMTYNRVKPLKITTYYDKPQTPLYIKSISLALGSDKYSAFNQQDLKLDTLFLTISTKNGKELASSYATAKDFSNMSYVKGKLLTFHFRDTTAYGELLHEGLTVNEAFKLTIKGFKQTDNFGIYAAECVVHPTKTEMLYESGVVSGIKWEPYIMLNGIYPTLEDYYVGNGVETGQVGDTIPVNMIPYNTNGFKYTAAYAMWGSDNDEFAFYSTFAPYDSINRTWNLDIEAPKYIRLNADYEYNLGDDEDPVTVWEYLRAFFMHIYALETPVIGDCIKIGKAGKNIVFHIVAIDGKTDVENSCILTTDTKVEKFVRDGQIVIRKNGELYNMVGQKIQNK